MDEVVEAVARTEGKITDSEIRGHVLKICAAVINRLKALMRLVATGNEEDEPRDESAVAAQTDDFDDGIMTAFTGSRRPCPRSAQRPRNHYDSAVEVEMKKWLNNTDGLLMLPATLVNGKQVSSRPESILQFWHCQFEQKTFVLLPLVARIVFAVPSSSAQIERDFGKSGQVVTALRASTSPQNIGMACFLHQNCSFVDIYQCPKLTPAAVEDNLPTNVKANLEPETIERVDWNRMQQNFSTSSASAFVSDDEEINDN